MQKIKLTPHDLVKPLKEFVDHAIDFHDLTLAYQPHIEVVKEIFIALLHHVNNYVDLEGYSDNDKDTLIENETAQERYDTLQLERCLNECPLKVNLFHNELDGNPDVQVVINFKDDSTDQHNWLNAYQQIFQNHLTHYIAYNMRNDMICGDDSQVVIDYLQKFFNQIQMSRDLFNFQKTTWIMGGETIKDWQTIQQILDSKSKPPFEFYLIPTKPNFISINIKRLLIRSWETQQLEWGIEINGKPNVFLEHVQSFDEQQRIITFDNGLTYQDQTGIDLLDDLVITIINQKPENIKYIK